MHSEDGEGVAGPQRSERRGGGHVSASRVPVGVSTPSSQAAHSDSRVNKGSSHLAAANSLLVGKVGLGRGRGDRCAHLVRARVHISQNTESPQQEGSQFDCTSVFSEIHLVLITFSLNVVGL